MAILTTGATRSQLVSKATGYAVSFWVLFVISIIHRIIAMQWFTYEGVERTYQPADWMEGLQLYLDVYGAAMRLGFASDAIFAAVVALPFMLFGRRLRMIALLALAAFYSANIEHIRYNFSHIDLSTMHNAADPVFVSGMLSRHFFKVILLLLLAGGIMLRLLRIRIARTGALMALPILLLLPAVAPLRYSFVEPGWMQSHPLLPGRVARSLAVDDRDFKEALHAFDPKAAPIAPGHNLLVLYLEGLSELSLELGDMRYLADLADDNIHLQRYFGTQLITANGLYSSLTGDLPHFVSGDLKWYEPAVQSDVFAASLPARLGRAGYHTAFLQSAELAFMRKGEILPRMGFDDVKGRSSWDHAYSQDGWGIDDKALFEHALAYLDTLEEDRPWFVSVLTTGTHAPYNVPDTFMPGEKDDRYRALRYLDLALEKLIDGLRSRGLMENTVVVLTSDESRERSAVGSLQGELGLNWLPMVVLHPSGSDVEIDTALTSDSFGDLATKLLAASPEAALDMARDWKRPLVFGNTYSNRLYLFDRSAREFVVCNTDNFNCAVYEGVDDPAALHDRAPDRTAHFLELERRILALESPDPAPILATDRP